MNFKITDRVLLVMFSGTISAFIANLFGYLSKLFYPTTIIMPEIALKTWVNIDPTHFFLNLIFGNLSSFIVGSLHALVFVCSLDITGWRYFWLKSFSVTITGWLLSSLLFLRVLNLQPEALDDILANILFLGAHIVYLSVSAFLIQKFGEQK